MDTFLQRYGKSLAAAAFAIITVVYSAISGDNHVEPVEWVNIAIAVATAFGVYFIPLDPRLRYGKTAVAVVLSALQVVTTVMLDGLDPSEWLLIAIAALTALGVGAAPAISSNGVSAKGADRDKDDPAPDTTVRRFGSP